MKKRVILVKVVDAIIGLLTRLRSNLSGVYAPGAVVRIPASPEGQALAGRVHQNEQPPQRPPEIYPVLPDGEQQTAPMQTLGVYAVGTIVQIPASPEDQALAERVHECKQPPQPPPMVYRVPPDGMRPL
jgi:hypothetical protein